MSAPCGRGLGTGFACYRACIFFMSSAITVSRFIPRSVEGSGGDGRVSGLVVHHVVSGEGPSPDKDKPREEHLVLVQEGVDPGDRILVFGAKVDVYVSRANLVFVHVSKVDSTGYGSGLRLGADQRSLSQSVLSGLIYAICKGLHSCTIFVNVCSRYNPEYIFTGSSNNDQKRVIRNGKLISWWVRAMNGISSAIAGISKGKISRNLYVPAEDPRSILHYCRGKNASQWKWGYPSLYDSRGLAGSWLPLFEDDPKTKVMKMKRNVSIRDLYKHLSVVDSCFFKETGFLCLSTEAQLDSSETSGDVFKSGRVYLNDAFKGIMSILTNSDFSTRSRAIEGTDEVSEFIENAVNGQNVQKCAVSYEIVLNYGDNDEIQDPPAQNKKRAFEVETFDVNHAVKKDRLQ